VFLQFYKGIVCLLRYSFMVHTGSFSTVAKKRRKRMHVHVQVAYGRAKFWLEPLIALADYHDLPTDLSDLSRKHSVTELRDTMQINKKAEAGKVKFVLPKKTGEVVITKEWDERQLQELIAE
jgi:3-dehydroquinate synthetase